MKKSRKRVRLFGLAVLSFSILLIISEIIVGVINSVLADTDLGAYSSTLLVLPIISLAFTGIIVFSAYNNQKRTTILIESLDKVAGGDYNAEINEKRAGTFAGVYKNFNKMTKELSSVKSLREEFVHSLSHEFKTPLCSIEGFANLLLEGGVSEDDEKKYLKIIADEAERLRKLADGVLTLSKLENMQFLGERSSFRLDTQIRDCVIMNEREWTKKNIEVKLDLENVTVTGDCSLLKHVWINLISNAVKFSPENSKIEIRLKRVNDNAVVTFKDNGCGIDEVDAEKIFDKYYRAEAAKGTEGNGLGLAICKRICTLSNGEIKCESKSGCGATFTVTLPIE